MRIYSNYHLFSWTLFYEKEVSLWPNMRLKTNIHPKSIIETYF